MIFSIMIQNENNNYDHMYEKIGNEVHKSMVGEPYYIESDVTLTLTRSSKGEPVCSISVITNDGIDKELIREKLKNAIDLAMDNI